MVCRRCCSIKCVSMTLATFSTLFLLLCGLQLYLTIRTKDYDILNNRSDPSMPEFNQKNYDKGESIRNGLFYGTLILGCLNIIVSIIALCTAVKKGGFKKLIVFTITSFLSTLVTFGFALGVLLVTLSGKKYFENTCKGQPLSGLQTKMQNYLLNYWPYVDATSRDLINTHMCTADCPCVKIDEQQWAPALYNLNSTTGQQQPISNLRFDGTISTFKQCYDILIKQNKTEPLSQNTLSIIYEYEMERNCIGLCETPRFYFYHNISSGPPTQPCVNLIKNDIVKSLGSLSLVLFISGIIIFISFCVQFGLWGRKSVSRQRSLPQKIGKKYDQTADTKTSHRKKYAPNLSDLTDN